MTFSYKSNSKITILSALRLFKHFKTNEKRRVSHFFFNVWPEFKAPIASKTFLNFLKHVRQTQAAMLTELDTT